jgi:hypothetical protein
MLALDFTGGFKKLVAEYGHTVTKKIDACVRQRHMIESGRIDSVFRIDTFREIVNQVSLQGRSAAASDKINGDIENDEAFRKCRIDWQPMHFEDGNSEGIRILRRYVSDRKMRKIMLISKELKSEEISDWILKLHRLRKQKKTIMGPKSDDDFLKEHGFFDRVPVDVHSKRFLFRTGILHFYAKTKRHNPSDAFSTDYRKQYEIFQDAIVTFCGDFLTGIEIRNFDLGKNPGIVDLIIWRHCATSTKYDCKNICGAEPRCPECCFKHSCMYYILKI